MGIVERTWKLQYYLGFYGLGLVGQFKATSPDLALNGWLLGE